MTSAFSVLPLEAPVGAEIRGVDLSELLSDDGLSRIWRAFDEYGVIFFRNQRLTPEQQIRFTKRFGALESTVLSQYSLPDHPEIILISNIQEDGHNIGVADAGNHWHTDSSYKATPAYCSILYAREVPFEGGRPLGDTLFVPTTGLYDTLPPATRERLDGLQAVHGLHHGYRRYEKSSEHQGARKRDALTPEQQSLTPEVIHPVVRTHPRTGRKCIYVNQGLIGGFVGMDEAESEALLSELCSLLTAEHRIYRHRWQVGDVLMWDNCATQHRATFDYAWPRHRRLMHRTSIVGTVPV